ncbi:hypothetical protein ACF5W4_04945 [Bacillota bacterium Lsc_1132]
MTSKVLEFRGIPLHHLGMYFEELGAEKTAANSLPHCYESSGWSAEILSEELITFTPNFKINAVKIRFDAENEETLQELIKNFRYKTTRVGG